MEYGMEHLFGVAPIQDLSDGRDNRSGSTGEGSKMKNET